MLAGVTGAYDDCP